MLFKHTDYPTGLSKNKNKIYSHQRLEIPAFKIHFNTISLKQRYTEVVTYNNHGGSLYLFEEEKKIEKTPHLHGKERDLRMLLSISKIKAFCHLLSIPPPAVPFINSFYHPSHLQPDHQLPPIKKGPEYKEGFYFFTLVITKKHNTYGLIKS